MGSPLSEMSVHFPPVLAGHTTSPTTVDWDGNGVPDLIIGGEDGFLHYHQNPRKPKAR